MTKTFGKLGKACCVLAVALAVAFSALWIVPRRAEAGRTTNEPISSGSVKDGAISSGDFNFDAAKVGAEGSYAIFSEANSSLVTKASAFNRGLYGVEDLFLYSAKVRIDTFAADGKISFCFGLKSVSAVPGAAESLGIAFTSGRNDWIAVAVTQYKEGEEETESDVLRETEIRQDLLRGSEFELAVRVTTANELYLTAGELEMFAGRKLDVSMTGRVGIFSNAENGFRVGDMSFTTYDYEVPLNSDFTETFDGDYNSSLLYTSASVSPVSGAGIFVTDGALEFRDVAVGHVTTRQKYSNFSLTFDLLNFRYKPEYDNDGNLLKVINNWLGFAVGLTDIKQDPSTTVRQETWLQVEGHKADGTVDHSVPCDTRRYVFYHNYNALDVRSMSTGGFDFWDPKDAEGNEYGGTVNVRFKMLDGVLSLEAKPASEQDYRLLYSYDLGITPTGYVRVFGWGNGAMAQIGLKGCSLLNMSIDNFRMENLDYETMRNSVAAPEHKSNLKDRTPDFEYTTDPDEGDLLGSKLSEGGGKGCGAVTIPAFGGLSVLALAAGMILMRRKG